MVIRRGLITLLLAGMLNGCGRAAVPPAPTLAGATVQQAGLTLPAGYSATVVIEGLSGPTQMILGPDKRLWVAQLNGAENAGQGQVVAFALPESRARTPVSQGEVLVSGLLKPVGIAVLADQLWIAAQNNLQRAPVQRDGTVGPVETVIADLPYNGRSLGTLTVSPQGRLIYETSGARQGNRAAPNSAMLWELDPATPTQPQPLARGLKNAYAHVFDASGRLWLTDIGDDPVNGQPPPDELNLWAPAADFGWPACYGQQAVASNYGGTAEHCRTTRPAVATFPPQSTPTSIVVSPWEENTLLVALWLNQVVLRVPFTLTGDNASGTPEPLITALRNPQHLLVLPDQSLLVSDFGAGKIYRIER